MEKVAKERKPRTKVRYKDNLHVYYGSEPNLERFYMDPAAFNFDLSKALTWYGNTKTAEKLKLYALHFMKESNFDKKYIAGCQKADESEFLTIGALCRLFSQGMTPPEDIDESLRHRVTVRLKKIAETHLPKKAAATESKSKFDLIQEAMTTRRRNYIAAIEEVLDSFILTWKTDFSMKKWIHGRPIQPVYVAAIRDHYQNLLSDIGKAISGDEYFKEAYSNFSRPRLCLLREFLQNIIKDCDEYCNNTKKVRKPRKKKEKSEESIVQKVKFNNGIPELNIKSVNPEKVLKSSQVWLFNTTYRTLTVLNATSEGFAIRGTTIYNFDEKSSMKKKIRKPNEVLPKVVNDGKVALRRLMDSIRCKPQTAKGRLGEDTVILRVL